MTKKIGFGYIGGKLSHLNYILPLLPNKNTYCEPFGGSASVLLNRSPSKVEIYNDKYSEVVNFFKVLRDDAEELVRLIKLTPYSREEFVKAINNSNNGDIERARCFYICCRQSIGSVSQKVSGYQWSYCINDSSKGMSSAVSSWLGSIEGLMQIAERFKKVQIENLSAIEIVNKYDSKETLFYCDPPYPFCSRGKNKIYYGDNEMSNSQHKELSYYLKKVKGFIAISSYKSDFMDELYPGWYIYSGKNKMVPISRKKVIRKEVLYTNYDISKINGQLQLEAYDNI